MIPVAAHHSFAATFDRDKPIVVKAVVAEVHWENPHTLMYVDVKDESGNVEKWTFETYPRRACCTGRGCGRIA